MPAMPFRILALGGGGARGIFQASCLKHLEASSGRPIREQFDLIAGTSTGSIIALALALDIGPDRVLDFYRNVSDQIFNPKLFGGFRKGPRFNQTVLRQNLVRVFGNKQLRDVKANALITASCLDRYGHRVFTSFKTEEHSDAELSAVDVALASSAAPTYFSPVQPSSQERSYVDGGLWANSPSLVAALYAYFYLGAKVDSIRVLSIGTGDFPAGSICGGLSNTRPYSITAIRTLFELMFAAQESAINEHTRQLIGHSNFLRISPQLAEMISLDNVSLALKVLPPLAEKIAGEEMSNIKEFLSQPLNNNPVNQSEDCFDSTIKLIPKVLTEATGLTAFYPCRKYYSHRKNASTIADYVNTAQKSVVMVSINLMTGISFENLCDVLRVRLEDINNDFSVIISLLNPGRADLIFCVSPAIGRTKEQLSASIKETIDNLISFKGSLSERAKNHLNLRVHNSIPFGSAIMLDHKEHFGRIQIETKPYKAVLNDSFAFEICPQGTSGFYQRLARGYEALIQDGYPIDSYKYQTEL